MLTFFDFAMKQSKCNFSDILYIFVSKIETNIYHMSTHESKVMHPHELQLQEQQYHVISG